jgi:ribonuclease-3
VGFEYSREIHLAGPPTLFTVSRPDSGGTCSFALQQRLQHQFANPALLQRAITHRSFSADNNERLEFLGDSVLSLAISSLLYQLASMPEGDLRACGPISSRKARCTRLLKLQLPDLLRLGEGEAKSGGKQRPPSWPMPWKR